MNLILTFSGEGIELYYRWAIRLIGVADLIVFALLWLFYRKDHSDRVTCGVVEKKRNSLFLGEIILLLLLGAALSLYMNELVSFLSFLIDKTEYINQMERLENGHSVFSLILWMGILAPLGEEAVFRWLVYLRLRDYCKHAWVAALVSGVLFGVYHGNAAQAVYASVLGFCFAMLLEWTGNKWSSVLLHIGANTGSIFLSEVVSGFPDHLLSATIVYLLLAFLAVLTFGFNYFKNMHRDHARRLE